MLYSLVLLLSINGQSDAYVLDYGLTVEDCAAAVQSRQPVSLYDRNGVEVLATLRCEAGER